MMLIADWQHWEFDAQTDERMRYLALAGAESGLFAQQTVSRGQMQYLHGDLIDSTMLTTDEMGRAGLPPATYTAFGEPVGEGGIGVLPATYTGFGELVTPDGQGGWIIGGIAPEGFPRYQYAGGWGYETGSFTADPTGPAGGAHLVALCCPHSLGEAPLLPPIVLLHVGARWYDPALGRFVQRDPISLAGGLNLYAYISGSPTARADPSGCGVFSPCDICGSLGAHRPGCPYYRGPRPWRPKPPKPPRPRPWPGNAETEREARDIATVASLSMVAVGSLGGPVGTGVAAVCVAGAWTYDYYVRKSDGLYDPLPAPPDDGFRP